MERMFSHKAFFWFVLFFVHSAKWIYKMSWNCWRKRYSCRLHALYIVSICSHIEHLFDVNEKKRKPLVWQTWKENFYLALSCSIHFQLCFFYALRGNNFLWYWFLLSCFHSLGLVFCVAVIVTTILIAIAVDFDAWLTKVPASFH